MVGVASPDEIVSVVAGGPPAVAVTPKEDKNEDISAELSEEMFKALSEGVLESAAEDAV